MQVLMSPNLLITVLVPTNTEIYLGNNKEYILISLTGEYIAIASKSYLCLKHQQCIKRKFIAAKVYFLLRNKSKHACALTIYYGIDAQIMT